MSDIHLEVGLRKAVEWITDQLRENPAANRSALIDEAGRRFDLSPLQAEFLFRQFLQSRNETPR
jgi:hypothetical protein